jgi:DNA-directed RNA polymerase I, II, and III subunit RPABC2
MSDNESGYSSSSDKEADNVFDIKSHFSRKEFLQKNKFNSQYAGKKEEIGGLEEDDDDDDDDDDDEDDYAEGYAGGAKKVKKQKEYYGEDDEELSEDLSDDDLSEPGSDFDIENLDRTDKKKPKKVKQIDDDYDNTPKHLSDTDDDYDDDDVDEDEDYLQKFDDNIRKNIIADYHPELNQISYEEIEALCVITRDETGAIIDPLHKTLPFLTKYEKARILGERAKQLNAGAKSFIVTDPSIIDGYIIALKELEEKKIPFIVKRPMPSGGCEYWKLKDLEILV